MDLCYLAGQNTESILRFNRINIAIHLHFLQEGQEGRKEVVVADGQMRMAEYYHGSGGGGGGDTFCFQGLTTENDSNTVEMRAVFVTSSNQRKALHCLTVRDVENKSRRNNNCTSAVFCKIGLNKSMFSGKGLTF